MKNLEIKPFQSASWMQCELFHRARVAGLTPLVEITLGSRNHRSRTFRVDVLLMKDARTVLACECKAYGAGDTWEGLKTRQARSYAECGIPAMLVKSVEDIEEAIAKAMAS